ncbi:MAG: hypothetical protein ACE5OZ_14055 [Candidatus Heimdallarchaeota archaeon]
MSNQEALIGFAIGFGFLSTFILLEYPSSVSRIFLSGIGAMTCGVGCYVPDFLEPPWNTHSKQSIHSYWTMCILIALLVRLVTLESQNLVSILLFNGFLGLLIHLSADTIEQKLQSVTQRRT